MEGERVLCSYVSFNKNVKSSLPVCSLLYSNSLRPFISLFIIIIFFFDEFIHLLDNDLYCV